MREVIKQVSEKFLKLIKSNNSKDLIVISHFDTDGITSAAIITKTLKKLDVPFSLKIIKGLESDYIRNLPKDKIILFLDLASNAFDSFKDSGIELENTFIIDHHEIIQEIPESINLINPQVHDSNKAQVSTAGLTYLFSKELIKDSNFLKDCAKLAILGMIGDTFDKHRDKAYAEIITDGEIVTKRGLLLYPSTRPINRVLEFGSSPYIPGVTGNTEGTRDLLREVGLEPENKKYKTLLELSPEEMKKLVTSILLRLQKTHSDEELIGDIFLIKLYNKLEDARELSARINACGRLGFPEVALQLCLESVEAKKKSESIHTKYRRLIISGLEFARTTKKVEGNGYIIINARENIKDTMVGTIASILSRSITYQEGTTITTMGLSACGQKIKISARNVGRTGRNVRNLLSTVINELGGEVGGHEFAAGGMIPQEKENDFIESLKKNLEVEVVRV